MYKQV